MSLTTGTTRSQVQEVLEKSQIAAKAMYEYTLTNNSSVIPTVDPKLTALSNALIGMGYGSSDGIPPAPAGVSLAAFTSAATTLPASSTYDNTVDPWSGLSSVSSVFNPGINRNLRPNSAPAVAIDVTGGIITVALKLIPTGTLSRAVANMGTAYLNLYTSGNPNGLDANYLRCSFGTSFYGDQWTGEWQLFRLPVERFGQFGTVADRATFLQSVKQASVEFTHGSANTDPFVIAIGGITSVPKAVTKGMVVFGFDDCRRDTFAYAYPKMKAYGFPGTLYPGPIAAVMGTNDASFMNKANLRELQANGWDIASQAYSTESPNMTTEQFQVEMANLLAFNTANGFEGGADGSYFSSISFGNPVYQPVFNSTFRTMRDFAQFNDAASPQPETLPIAALNKTKAYGVNSAANSATNGLIPYMTRAAERNGYAEFAYHALGSGDFKHAVDGGVLTSFEAALEWCHNNRALVDVVTKAEVVRRLRSGTTTYK